MSGWANRRICRTSLSGALLLAVNTLVLYRVETKRGVSWRWALALSAMDLALLTGGLTVAIGSEGAFFVLYYAALAMFAAVSSSFRVTLAATTVVAAVHAALSLSTGLGGTLEIQPDPVLLLSILAMYAVVSAVSLVSRFDRNRSWFDRVRRREAVERGEELQQERIELSQTIHNTIAQSAYLIGLGLETAIELADGLNDESRDELIEKLEATLALSRSTMWDLRHPINVGPIFEGRALGPRAAFSRIDFQHHHVDYHGSSSSGRGTASPCTHTAASPIRCPQCLEQRAQTLQRRQDHHRAVL